MTKFSGAAINIDVHDLQRKLSRLKDAPVMIVGDIMLDEYLIGDATRISPEAPIPVVLIEEKRLFLGGAGNVARNIIALGGKVCIISCCGDDENGQKLCKGLQEEGIDFSTVLNIPKHATTTKTRVMARKQQMLRIDHESDPNISGKSLKSILGYIRNNIANCKALIISDYGKGMITAEFLQALHEICAKYPDLPVLVDPKLPNFHLYTGAYILTPNAKETSEGASLPTKTTAELLLAGKTIFEKLHCKNLLTTLGPKGMVLFRGENEALHIPTVAQDVFDVTGAGDTVIATVALALAAGLELLDACVLANYAAGIVVAEVGAATASKVKLSAALKGLRAPSIKKIL